jgi:hypothetical protein
MRAIVALVCCACLTGCGSGHTARPSASARPSATGVVEGRVLRPPGIDPRSGGAPRGTPVPVNGDPVEAHDPRGRTAAKAVTAARGRFRMTLPPGTYRIVEDVCGVSKRVTVHGGATAPVTLTIPNAC